MATKLLETYKQKISSLTLVPGSGGCFELTLDGDLAYSKLATGEHADQDQLVAEVGEKLG